MPPVLPEAAQHAHRTRRTREVLVWCASAMLHRGGGDRRLGRTTLAVYDPAECSTHARANSTGKCEKKAPPFHPRVQCWWAGTEREGEAKPIPPVPVNIALQGERGNVHMVLAVQLQSGAFFSHSCRPCSCARVRCSLGGMNVARVS